MQVKFGGEGIQWETDYHLITNEGLFEEYLEMGESEDYHLTTNEGLFEKHLEMGEFVV